MQLSILTCETDRQLVHRGPTRLLKVADLCPLRLRAMNCGDKDPNIYLDPHPPRKTHYK